MSLPKHTAAPSLPETPSSPVPRPRSEQPQGTPDEQPALQTTDEHYDEEKSRDAPPPQQPQFHPFFTLIEDAQNSEYFHPTVHYIFSDDDTDIVTEAALRSLESEQEGSNTLKEANQARDYHGQMRDEEREGDGDSGPPSPEKETLLPPRIPGVKDNYIILDVKPGSFDRQPVEPGSGPGTRSLSTSPASQQLQPQQQQQQRQFTVTSAQSLTPSWQVLDTQVVPAPTFENTTPDEQPVNGGLMLKIHGTTGVPSIMPRDREREKDKGSQRLEEMMDQFAKRMSELRQVIEAGEQEITSEDPTDGRADPSAGEKPEGQLGEEGAGDGQAETERQGDGTGDIGQGSNGERKGGL